MQNVPFNFHCGWVGIFGYDALGVPGTAIGADSHYKKDRHDANCVPDAAWVFADRMLVWDHESGLLYQVSLLPISKDYDMQISASLEWFRRNEELLLYSVLMATTNEEAREAVSYFHLKD
jgi:para-aminobenzoate synthetase